MNAPLKTVYAPHLQRSVRFGRRRPKAHGPCLRLRDYLRSSALPNPPASCDFSTQALPALRDIMGNDNVGDCVIAARYHGVGTLTGNAGALFHATLAQVLGDYSAITGYNAADPSTDQGTDEVTANNWYLAHGFADGTRPLGYLLIDATNWLEVMTACWIFEGGLDPCMELADAWINPFPSTDDYVWDAAPGDPDNGHCVESIGYDKVRGLRVDSWALFGWVTPAGLAARATIAGNGSLYLCVSPDQIAKGATKDPHGLAWADLIADFDALGGHLPIPAPPAPAPVPAPPPTPAAGSLAWAQAQVTAAVNAGPHILTRGVAIAEVNAALAKAWPTS